MRFNVTNRTSEVRSFTAGGRFLTLAGGEVERNVELGDDEAEALRVTTEFYVSEVAAAPIGLADGEFVISASRGAKFGSDDATSTQKP